MTITEERYASVAAAFRSGAQSYGAFGAPLYSALCLAGAEDREIVELATHAQLGAQPVFHLLTAVHYLILGNPDDPLARYFASLAAEPLPAQEAWPSFRHFCRTRRDQIIETLSNTTVQTTFADRCATILAPIAWVANAVGEPLHLIEIGCSAGVLLTFDRYAYEFEGHGRFGAADARLTFSASIKGDPPLRIPQIASRTGLDLRPLDARKPEERRWLIAQIFPEYRRQREQLDVALDVVAATDLRMLKGDALETLPGLVDETDDPICIFHSVCLSYWTEQARAELDTMLTSAAGNGRTIYRVGSEPSARFSAWNKGHDRTQNEKPPPSGEITMTRYAGGEMDSQIVATNGVGRPMEWTGWTDSLSDVQTRR